MSFRQLPSWETRPIEVANLLNPAFIAVLLRYSILGYQSVMPDGIPFALPFLVLPLVLHKSTRDALPRTARTTLHSWTISQPGVQVGYYERTRQLVPFVKEGMVYGLISGLFIVTEGGNLLVTQKITGRTLPWTDGSEPGACRKKAEFVGKWFARAGNVDTIFSIFGVQV